MDVLDGFDFSAVGSTDFSVLHAPQNAAERDAILTALENAASEGNLSAVQDAYAALERLDPELDTLKHPGSALNCAVTHAKHGIVGYLVAKGAQPAARDVLDAVEAPQKKREILGALFGAWDINRKLQWDWPSVLAFAVDDLPLCQWLMEQGANPNARCDLNITPLSYAVYRGRLEVIELFFASGGSVEHGQPLHWAVLRKGGDRCDIIRDILRKGALINEKLFENDNGAGLVVYARGTPLHLAAASGHLDAVELLIENGADMSLKDTWGELAMQIAERKAKKMGEDMSSYNSIVSLLAAP